MWLMFYARNKLFQIGAILMWSRITRDKQTRLGT